jgi:hypothetical protein
MSSENRDKRTVSPAAQVFSSLQAEESLLPGHASAVRRSGALMLALLVLAATPLYLAANAAGLIGDAPEAIAKGSNSGPGGGGDDDDGDNSGPGSGDDDDDSNTRLGTDDTSRNGHSTRGTTNDNDTNTRTNGQTQTRTRGQTQTRTRTGS